MTITEKILARAAGVDTVVPGQLVDAKIDVVMCHDVTTPPAISMLVAKGIDRVFDPDKIQDHASYERPHQYATGVVHVLVNGVPVIQAGEHTGAKPGCVVRGPGVAQLQG